MSPFGYMFFLFSLLCIYLGFLVLPRGFKAQYCRGSRRRYRRKQRSGRRRRNNVPPPPRKTAAVDDEETPTKPNNYSRDESIHRESLNKNGRIKSQRNGLSAHSLVKKRLVNPPGLRLIAHGIKVRPRPVWVQLHMTHLNHNEHSDTTEFHNCLTWRAELKSSPSQQGNACELGSIRKVSLNDILGFEVGQKTVALRRLSTERSIRESECFSILTVSGTLDLQVVPYEGASAENVRDAILDCLSSVLSSAGRENVTMLPTRTSTISTVSF